MNDKLNFIQSSQNIIGFIPAIVLQYLLENRKRGIINLVLPDKQTLSSVVMFADISGFTSVSEKLSRLGPEGAEVVAFIINRYMELLAKAISKSGGDIFKFVGDSIVVIWPPHTDLESLCRQALHSALDIQNQLNETSFFQNIQLSVKIGIGVGDVSVIYVGGVFNRSEYLAIGNPLLQAFNCERIARGGQILISSEVHALIGQDYNCDKLTEKSYLLKSIRYDKKKKFKLKMRADAQMITNNIPLS